MLYALVTEVSETLISVFILFGLEIGYVISLSLEFYHCV